VKITNYEASNNVISPDFRLVLSLLNPKYFTRHLFSDISRAEGVCKMLGQTEEPVLHIETQKSLNRNTRQEISGFWVWLQAFIQRERV